METGDTELFNAAVLAAAEFREIAAQLRKSAASGNLAPLVAYLRGDKPLSSVDRETIASLLSGEIARTRGRPSRPRLVNLRRSEVVQFYKDKAAQLKAEGTYPYAEAAVALTAKHWRIPEAQIRAWLKDRRLRK